jgi:hypothetical protein
LCRYAEQKGGFFDNTVPTHYDKLEKWLNLQGTTFMACDEVKVCDFPTWEMIDQIEMMAKVRRDKGAMRHSRRGLAAAIDRRPFLHMPLSCRCSACA